MIFVYKPHESRFEEMRKQIGCGLQFFPIEKVIDLKGRLDDVYDKLRSIYSRVCKKHKIPMIDLSKTFDPQDRKHYGSTTIEPSNLSGESIANLIKTVIEVHDFSSDGACYFSPKCNGVVLTQTLS